MAPFPPGGMRFGRGNEFARFESQPSENAFHLRAGRLRWAPVCGSSSAYSLYHIAAAGGKPFFSVSNF
ncbi:MAG: hypothetical protein DBY36_03715 [Clostridiales bacterium]|nr:MAG: hypothetical protein DBY36_03715 [Clostridiales bacterium]